MWAMKTARKAALGHLHALHLSSVGETSHPHLRHTDTEPLHTTILDSPQRSYGTERLYYTRSSSSSRPLVETVPQQSHSHPPSFNMRAVPIPVNPPTAIPPTSPRTALIPIMPSASLHREGRQRTNTQFYWPHDIHAVSEAISTIMETPHSPLTTMPCLRTPTSSGHMPSTPYQISNTTRTGDIEKIETIEAPCASDNAQFIAAIMKEIHTLQPLTRDASGGYSS